MILSNVSIQAALDEGRLIIEPQPAPRRPDAYTGAPCPYQTTSVDLRLGHEISHLKEGLAANIDLRLGRFSDLFGPNSESRRITAEQPFSLGPNRFVLARTLEKVALPIRDIVPSLAARVEGKSSYARCGLLVHFTAPTIHAGFEGTITLELINLGPLPILLYPEAPICQLIVEEVHGVPFRNESQFQHQTRPGGRTKRTRK
jgi:dCTP deaminase